MISETFIINNTDLYSVVKLIDEFSNAIAPIANKEYKKYIASQAVFYADYKTYKNADLPKSPFESAVQLFKQSFYASMFFFTHEDVLYLKFETSHEQMLELFKTNLLLEKVDIVPTQAKFTGLMYEYIHECKETTVKEIMQYIKPFEVRVTELALNLIFVAFEEDQSKKENLHKSFNDFLGSSIGNNLLLEKKRHISETIKKELSEEDLA